MYKNNQLIPTTQNNLIPKVASTLSITNKLIIESNRTMVMEIFLKNPEMFVSLISKFYPFKDHLLEKYEFELYWYYLSGNNNLNWSTVFIEKHKNNWIWSQLSGNSHLPWSIELIEKYENYWKWEQDKLEEYNDQCDWDEYDYFDDDITLSGNEYLPWSLELIEKYKEKWQWSKLSKNNYLPWSKKLIKEYKKRWVWMYLSGNNAIPWSLSLLEKYKEKWKLNIDYDTFSGYFNDKYVTLFRNNKIALSSIVKIYLDPEFNWENWNHCKNTTQPYNIEWRFNEYYAYSSPYENFEEYSKIAYLQSDLFFGLSRSNTLKWTMEIIEKHNDRWSWDNLSLNKSLPWSVELIEKYKEKWNWCALSINDFQWTIELIEKYKDEWVWGNLSNRKNLMWSIELIEKYENKWDWENLSLNECLPWSIELIVTYNKKWHWKNIGKNVSVWNTLKPYIDDELIEEVIIK